MPMLIRILACLFFLFALQCCRLPQAQSGAKRAKAATFTATNSEGKAQKVGQPWRGTHLLVFFRGDW